MQGVHCDYWQEMSVLNRESRSVLMQNENLQQRLKDLNQQMNAKDTELYNLETRLENLDIFEQHLTSLNLRCEFLDKQVSNLESKQRVSPPLINSNLHLAKMTANSGLKGFKDRSSLYIEWRTTETTFENLCTEFKYLKEQLSIANNQTRLDSSHDDSLLSHSSTNRSASLFSETEIPSMDDACSSLVIVSTKDHSTSKYVGTDLNLQAKKKKLLKMESFLNFTDTNSNNKESNAEEESHNIGPLRGFNINTIHDNPLFEGNFSIHADGKENIAKPELHLGKAPTRPIKKKLDLVSLPCIAEENRSFPGVNNRIERENVTFEHHDLDIVKDNDCHQISGQCDQKSHRRYSSLPETSSLDGNNLILAFDESVRHFTSYETGLNSKYASHKKFNISDFLFVKPNEPRNRSGQNSMNQMEFRDPCMISSSPFSTFKASYIDDESFYGGPDDNNKFSTQCVNSPHIDSDSDSDSDESYGDENATPLILKKESKLSLYKCKSHESIFSTMAINTRDFPMRERNLDLKAQTMKWLKPNNPTVSFSTQPFVTSNNVALNNNAHDDIINILHSGANIDTESDPQTPTRTQPESPKSSIPSNIFSSPMPIKSNESQEFNNGSDGISSWFSNFIPNSAFTNPEVGKLIGKPSAKNLEVKNSLSRSRGKPTSFTLTPINFRKVRTNFNGPSSSLTINKNGERIISHGYGSSFNNSVISSRISHGALRDALESDIV